MGRKFFCMNVRETSFWPKGAHGMDENGKQQNGFKSRVSSPSEYNNSCLRIHSLLDFFPFCLINFSSVVLLPSDISSAVITMFKNPFVSTVSLTLFHSSEGLPYFQNSFPIPIPGRGERSVQYLSK